jgi:beta-galactosidase
MKNKIIALLYFLQLFLFSSCTAQTTAHKFEAGKNTFLLDGKHL